MWKMMVARTVLVCAAVFSAAGARAQSINIGSASGAPGQVVPVDITISVPASLTTGVAGTQNDITFDLTNVSIPAKGSVPDCTRNQGIGKDSTTFRFLPTGCTPGANCTGIRALVFSITDSGANLPIPDGSALYTCNIQISNAAALGPHTLAISNIVMSFPTPPGGRVPGATGNSGTVIVSTVPTTTPSAGATPTLTAGPPTPTAVATSTVPAPTGTATSTVTSTATSTVTATATAAGATTTPAGTETPVPFAKVDMGCQIDPIHGEPSAWLLLFPAFGLLFVRRRRHHVHEPHDC